MLSKYICVLQFVRPLFRSLKVYFLRLIKRSREHVYKIKTKQWKQL